VLCRPEAARASVAPYTYEACCDVFHDSLVQLHGGAPLQTPALAYAAE
jgi:hypothetical protein